MFLLRDPHCRHEKVVLREHGGMPTFPKLIVDGGSEDTRVLLSDVGRLCLRSQAAGELIRGLHNAFRESQMSAYTSYRDGGPLQALRAHVSILANADDTTAEALSRRLPLLVAQMTGTHAFDFSVPTALAFLGDYYDTVVQAPAHLMIAPDAVPCLAAEELCARGVDPVLQVIKLAHVLCVLDRLDSVTRRHAERARAIYDAASEINDQSYRTKQVREVAEKIAEILSTAENGEMSRTEIIKLLNHSTTRLVTTEAIAHLVEKGRIECTLIKTNGRPTQLCQLAQCRG